jgi:hypothetical protein
MAVFSCRSDDLGGGVTWMRAYDTIAKAASAPNSASSRPAMGAAMKLPSSSTRMPRSSAAEAVLTLELER